MVGRQILLLAILSILTSSMLILLAPLLAVPLLGEGWAMAGTVTAILAIPMSLQLLAGPLMPILPMIGREGRMLLTQIVRLALVVAALAFSLGLGLGLVRSSFVFGIAIVSGYIYMLIVIVKTVRDYDVQAHGRATGPTSREG
jgi:O-antigen/teichoic acid export membrane protein